MLSVPTLWTAFVVNFLALGLIWAYVMRSYSAFEPARYWAASAFVATVGAGLATLRFAMDTPMPLLGGGTVLIFSACLAAMGVKRFYGQPVSWRASALITGLSFAMLLFFIVGYDSAPMRVLVYSVGMSVPLVTTLKLLLSPHGRLNPGARLAGTVSVLIITLYAFRVVAGLSQVGLDFSFLYQSPAHSAVVLALLFLAMAWNFGLLLMAMDRLRSEVAHLALLDDLTGVGNRRYLMQRLTEECARSERSGEAFAMLAIDLDGFKGINDTRGHAAGDASLQHFALMTQTRLRPGDMLARTGGDEFCVVLPASTPREGAMIARRILEVCREDARQRAGADVPITVSIGIAQWTREIGAFPDRLIAAADRALYAAKDAGKNCYMLFDSAPPLAPESEAMLEHAAGHRALRKQA